jgi:uncharacterized protein (DUF1684 family)
VKVVENCIHLSAQTRREAATSAGGLRNGCSDLMSVLQDFRADKDAFLRHHPQSPLTNEQRARFEGLSYYPENDALVVRDTPVNDGVDLEGEIVMPTTTGGMQTYRRAGIVRFDVDGVTAQVTLLASSDSDVLFLPFRSCPALVGGVYAQGALRADREGCSGRRL